MFLVDFKYIIIPIYITLYYKYAPDYDGPNLTSLNRPALTQRSSIPSFRSYKSTEWIQPRGGVNLI